MENLLDHNWLIEMKEISNKIFSKILDVELRIPSKLEI